MKKNNILDYLFLRGNLSFNLDSVNEVDALVFSVLAYIDLDKIELAPNTGLKELWILLSMKDEEESDLWPKFMANSVKKLVEKISKSERYQKVRIRTYKCVYDEVTQMQFAATVFELSEGNIFIAYRGTDESLVGMKEDLNMSFSDGIPSQTEAHRFAEDVILSTDKSVILGGHSKGGNLAVWASAYLERDKQGKITDIYCNDSPGFTERFLSSDKYKTIRDRIHSYVPEASIVGILLEHDDYITIESTNLSVFQHDPFSWCVNGSSFVRTERRTIVGEQMDFWLNSWIKALSNEEREQVVEYIWSIVSSANAKTVFDINEAKLKSILSMQKAFIVMEKKKQKQMVSNLSKLMKNSIAEISNFNE